ncbi:Serine-rich adhesin for platelets like [Quillaja saponaria]|uniref:Serine-rich adhesin for platelets like n=1 Tax=Quillaja saponaria TaxID=32244 RepID=A0AAD7PYV2_QUISA|nr:Serine-rich adhesin for platelets like [Quillaja saponaria]
MPVSGHEETGVKSFAGQFSDFIAGVPIKKRRFPLIRPSSPLSEGPSSLPEESDLLRKDHSGSSQGSTLSNASIAGAPIKKRWFPLIHASLSPSKEPCSLPKENDVQRKELSSTSQGSTLSTSSSSLSDTNKNIFSEESKGSFDVTKANVVQSNSNSLRPKLEDTNIAIQSCTLDKDMGSKDKRVTATSYDEKLGSEMIRGNSELFLATKECLTLNTGSEISKNQVKGKFQGEISVVPESTDLSLGLKEHFFPALVGQEIDKSFQRGENAENISLDLSLSKEEGSTQCLKSDAELDIGSTHLHSNRANWDLNTTMDAWEETANGAAKGRTSFDVSKSAGGALDIKPSICPTGIPGIGVTSEKLTNLESENRVTTMLSTLDCQFKHNMFTLSFVHKSAEESSMGSAEVNPSSDKFAEEPSVRSAEVNPCSDISTLGSPSAVASTGDENMVSNRTVKSEPIDENIKTGLKDTKSSSVGSLDSVTLKSEILERFSVEAFKLSNYSTLNLVDPKSIKSEPGHVVSQEILKTTGGISHKGSIKMLQGSDSCPYAMAMPIIRETASTPGKSFCSAELTAGRDASGDVENHVQSPAHTEALHLDVSVSQEACQTAGQVALETVTISTMGEDGSESSATGMKETRVEEENGGDPMGARLKIMNEFPPDPMGNSEGCVSDDEKITLLADELDDDYESEYESDGNHALAVSMDKEQAGREDDDYEDGEVREPLVNTEIEVDICDVREVEHADCSSYDNKQVASGGPFGDDYPTASHVEENDNNTGSPCELNKNDCKVDSEISERSLADVKPTGGADLKRPVRALQQKPFELSERKNVQKALEIEISLAQAADGSPRVDIAQCGDESVKIPETVIKIDSAVPKIEAFSNDSSTKDAGSGGNQGRIINLSGTSSASSPSKTRSISGRSLPSRAGREILSYDAIDGDKLHRGRDEIYIDGLYKFSRERYQHQSHRNPRLNFVRGRGRVTSRSDTLHGDWESDRSFAPDFYGPRQFRTPRNKYASAVADTDLEYNNVAPDGSFVSTGRVGRKPLSDEDPMCHNVASRRRSPGGRDVPSARGIQIGRRIPRNISPSRYIGEDDGSELVGIRHNEKFMRGFPDDVDPMFTCPQPAFEGLDGRFARGNRNFSSIQRRCPPHLCSKSPVRSRTRSPGPWSSPRRRSPRRRSPEGFGGHPGLTHRRSPVYRVERMRSSPDCTIFPGNRVIRRHGSPSYMSRPSNHMRDIDSGREHGHPRSVISGRSPSGRILLRNRRVNVVEPRERTGNEEYFGGPIHSGQLLELGGEGNNDERRRFGERRGLVRNFRPPYNNGNNVGENFHLDGENGPRPYRFCTDDDSEFHEFHERGNLREREFDRRIKNRPTNVPRRTRNIDDLEANYRHGGQVWSDDGFDDISRVKRKRF